MIINSSRLVKINSYKFVKKCAHKCDIKIYCASEHENEIDMKLKMKSMKIL